MIEPHSAQLGASAWVWKLTLVLPKLSVTGDEPPFPLLAFPLPFAACPLPSDPFVAITASDSEALGASATSAETAVAFGASDCGSEGDATDADGGDAGVGAMSASD